VNFLVNVMLYIQGLAGLFLALTLIGLSGHEEEDFGFLMSAKEAGTAKKHDIDQLPNLPNAMPQHINSY
jgi:hypothetical protein